MCMHGEGLFLSTPFSHCLLTTFSFSLPPSCSQHLSDEFRVTYCKLWMAILQKDLVSVKNHAQALNGGELYHLLACIITARSWDSITKGVDRTAVSRTEVRGLWDDLSS